MRDGRYGRPLLWFFFALYALTSSGNAFRVPDEFEVYFQAEHLVDAGDISVPQTLAVREGDVPILFGKFGADGRRTLLTDPASPISSRRFTSPAGSSPAPHTSLVPRCPTARHGSSWSAA
jgi:hypothetical protein